LCGPFLFSFSVVVILVPFDGLSKMIWGVGTNLEGDAGYAVSTHVPVLGFVTSYLRFPALAETSHPHPESIDQQDCGQVGQEHVAG
jgi:hypothetical protein